MSTQARNRSRALREATLAAERRRRKQIRLLTGGGGVVIVGLLVAIIVSLVNALGQGGQADQAAASSTIVAPANATADGAIRIGEASAPVTVEIYLDYLCPYCGRFERANGDELARLVSDRTVAVNLYPLSFLDRLSSGTQYSTRAANAIATVADRAPDKVLAFNNALFAGQPAEGGSGLTDAEIAAIAQTAGVPDDVVNRFADNTFRPWIAAATAKAFDSGVTGTPTVKINGKVYDGDLYTVGPLTEAVTVAKAR